MSDNSNDLGAFLAGFVIGGLVGAATALILAPQSGEETRSTLAARGHEWRELSEDRIGPFRERAGATLEDVRARAQEATSDVQERSRIVLSEGKARLSKAQELVDETIESTTGDASTEEE